MGINPAKFIDETGVTRLEGEIDGIVNADTINGVAINNTPSGAGETLTTVDAANAQWGAGGGGFTIGSSFLIADSAAAGPFLSGDDTPPQFTLALSAGADIAIDGGNAALINIATTGWYSIAVYQTFTPAIAGPLRASVHFVVNAGTVQTINEVAITSIGQSSLVIPAISLAASDVVNVDDEASGDGWSISATPNALRIVRLS